ncbi:TPA: YnfU family zinc-binding protein [Klebsiella variicola subsp. variicola]
MSYASGLRHFKERPVEVRCPKCSLISNQKAVKLRKNMSLTCSHCGHSFLPSDCKKIGG